MVADPPGSDVPLPAALPAAVADTSGSDVPLPVMLPPAVAEGSGSEISMPAADPLAIAAKTSTPPTGGSTFPAELAPTEATLVAEPTAVAQPAAAEPEAVPEEAAVVEPVGEKSVDPVVKIHMDQDQVEVPACPRNAALHYIHPPAPAQPIDVPRQGGESATAVAVDAAFPPAVAAQYRIESRLLALAREIRRPNAYVGYSAFIVMGLLKKRQPCI